MNRFKVITFVVVLLLSVALCKFAEPDAKCLQCICNVESGCRPLTCKYDVTGLACGYYQLHEAYFTDCKQYGDWGKGYKITLPWKECSYDPTCSKHCVINYMQRYGTFCTGGRAPSCEDYARIHNGGPNGCKSSATIGYWQKVAQCYK